MGSLVRARALMADAAALGVSIDDLVMVASSGAVTPTESVPAEPVVPTVAEYVAMVAPSFSPGTLRTYRSYWRVAVAHVGGRRLDTIGVDDCQAIVNAVAERARKKRPGSAGRSARENCVAALRALFARAERAGHVSRNPAAELAKPRRLPGRRRALTEVELVEVVDAVRTTSRDPGLDLLMVRFHLESGARQEGALRLRLDDLDARRATVFLREKFGAEREQPVSPSLVTALERHAGGRGGESAGDAVFRTRRSRAVTRRHYDTLFRHVQDALPWSTRAPVTAHVLRHTGGTAVERVAGYAVAEAFLGHAPSTVTAIYAKGCIDEVAAAVAQLTGEPHPLERR